MINKNNTGLGKFFSESGYLKVIIKIVSIIFVVVLITTVSLETIAKITNNDDLAILSKLINKRISLKDKGISEVTEKEKNGWRVNLTLNSNNTKSFTSEIEGKWDIKMEIYTCDKDPKNAKWLGIWNWDWSIKTVDSKDFVKADEATDKLEFKTVNGQANYPIGVTLANLNIDSSNVTTTFFMKNLGEEVKLSGTLQSDYVECSE